MGSCSMGTKPVLWAGNVLGSWLYHNVNIVKTLPNCENENKLKPYHYKKYEI